jgi:hypothetical protein
MAALALTAGSTPPAPARPCAVLDALMAADNANDR